ncbi:hypothetical protein FRC14_004788 [Serendipita sp. 396]|nr:hypothetical protein FRC14_004788 [Serendipita sp. 396]KAG8837268.1 hypothetical protein FRC18_009676 [Serendipita sp. 400]KAG8878685.1 hypothetical protein FRC20_006362 [Serendipita sp. 405]
MSSSRTRSSTFTASQSAPSSSSIRDVSERRSSSKGKRAKDLTCETCGKVYKARQNASITRPWTPV